MKKYDLEVPISINNEALTKDDTKCITCGYCKEVCKNNVTVARMYEINPDREPICINCGQCANICPTEAIKERMDYLKVKEILHNKNGKKVVMTIAPAVRASLSEEFSDATFNVEKKVPTAMRKLGVDYVFDILFGADLTIMEEAMELVKRITNNEVLPQFTSCCPAWVKYCEIFYPQLLPNLSTAKSPIAMQGTIIKTYFADKIGVSSNDIVNVVVAPCTAKKAEIKRPELNHTEKDTDYAITTREFAKLLKEENINLLDLEDSNFDSPLGIGTGAAIIFGNTGGVCEAALRTAYYMITGKNLEKDAIVFNSIRGMEGIKEAAVTINGKEVKVAVCNGMKNAKELIDKLINKEVYYDFIEVMNCIGGCIAGGGQSKMTLLETDEKKLNRMKVIYDEDAQNTLRFSHENPEIINVYQNYLKYPNSPLAEELLHTHYIDKSYLLTENSKINDRILRYTDNCESCVTKPCQTGCPLNNDITGFIKKVKNNEYEEAFKILNKTTILAPLCGRICPHFQQCQGKCVKGVSYDAVEIGKIEAFIGDMAIQNGWKNDSVDETHHKVAIIGGGPAGLTCAAFLRRNGIGVTIYEKHDYLGGLLIHGIPAFRLPKDLVQEVVKNIVDLGIDVKLNTELGKDITLNELKNEYDAIFIGIGANLSNKMNIEGEDFHGVFGGNEILEYNSHPDYQDKVVIVSGGGNVAMDVSRTAIRNGAKKVIVVYRRSEKEMPADSKEIEEAKEDGVEFLFLSTINKVVGNGKVEGIEIIKNELVKKEGESRPSPVPVEGSNYILDCDYVMMAIGSHPQEYVERFNINLNKGRIEIDKDGRTNNDKIFAGGDIAGSKGTVAWASRAGRNAAYAIIDYLKNNID